MRPPQNASAIKGSNAVLQCGVVSDPSVVVTWQWKHRNSQNDINIIPADDQRRSVNNAGSLAIKQVRPADVGIYQCDVTSSGGNDVASAALKVIGKLSYIYLSDVFIPFPLCLLIWFLFLFVDKFLFEIYSLSI